jgi:hypothetical protein
MNPIIVGLAQIYQNIDEYTGDIPWIFLLGKVSSIVLVYLILVKLVTWDCED